MSVIRDTIGGGIIGGLLGGQYVNLVLSPLLAGLF